MMGIYKAFVASILLAVFGSLYAADTMEADDFVDEASAKGIAEIESGKLALEKSTSSDIKAFAQQMVDEHTATNERLAQIARSKNLEVADEAELMSKAKKWILQLREGESFDEAYAKNQVASHENTVQLYRRAAQDLKDPELKAFAGKTLPVLEHHWEEARQLAASHGKRD
ncbi:DUF4142 domain-containing protein [Azotobacter vinelandii]|uniref:DUF4142 domain-containing protein n=1 Tax=Azotobacter vinelandii TaxID=354 RepID=UPI000773C658|nr:DUF4142 domain-containing protein [Azotobacter vinelandii]WKN23012.1 DUF4142 domain-containing protein [Azotobacter vinelandii]